MAKPLMSQRSAALSKHFNSHLWKAAQHRLRERQGQRPGPARSRIQNARVDHKTWPADSISTARSWKPVIQNTKRP